ncbi:F-box protein At5g65850-like [Fagus crenata]
MESGKAEIEAGKSFKDTCSTILKKRSIEESSFLGHQEKKKKKTSVPAIDPEPKALPKDVIIEILGRLPAKCLLRFKCVCKEWCSIIQDQVFIETHLNKAPFITHYTDKDETSLGTYRIVVGNFETMGTVNGLSLEKSCDSEECRIRNPTTRQILDLPHPHKGTFCVVFCYKSLGQCKLVSLYKDETCYGCQVLTIEKDDQWRELEVPSSQGNKVLQVSLINIPKEVVHYTMVIMDGTEIYVKIYTLDFENECFSTTNSTLTQGSFTRSSKVSIIGWDGCLSYAEVTEEALNVWVLEDYKEKRWSKRKIVLPLTFLKENHINMKKNLIFCEALSDELFFIWNRSKMFAYNMKTGTITCTSSASEGKQILYEIQETLVTLKGMRPEK